MMSLKCHIILRIVFDSGGFEAAMEGIDFFNVKVICEDPSFDNERE